MKRGVVEGKLLIIIIQLVLVLMVAASLFAYVGSTSGNTDFVMEFLSRDIGLTTTILAASPSLTATSIYTVEVEDPIFVEFDAGKVSTYQDPDAKFYFPYLTNLDLQRVSLAQKINDVQYISKTDKIDFKTLEFFSCKKEFTLNIKDLPHKGKFEDVDINIVYVGKGDFINIVAPFKLKDSFCSLRSKEDVSIGFFDVQNISIEIDTYE